MSPSFFFLNEDARILDQIRNGEEEALVRLYETNERQIQSFVMKNSGTQDDAKDMLQEAIVILWERVHTGRYEHTAKISTFIFATVRNLWLRRLARTRRESPLEIDNETTPSEESSALDEMIETEQAAAVVAALNKLGDPCRRLLVLYYWEELSMEQIAEQMGFANSDTAKSKKYLCKKELQRLLAHLG
ncbi:MAG TPA: RNA polymerase subunit sigma [Bacteroidetes bacterium]|jgi:RNA polymerase sigma factor (sigma-70 family)|nr:RNA polymerase subunit sigma [Bacteroidota bacterium]